MVKDIGPLDAKVMIVGECPGAIEEKNGVPFSGSAGKLLQQMVRHSGLDWRECYVTYLSDRRPRRNDFGIFYEDKSRRTPTAELLQLSQSLKDKITRVKPDVIVPLGAEALRAVTGRRGIDNWRGCPLSYELRDGHSIHVIPTYHPNAVMQKYSFHPVAEMDLEKAKRLSEGGKKSEDWNIILEPTFQEVKRWLEKCRGKTLAFDLESVGETVRCLGFARDRTSLCIPFLHFASYNPRGEKKKQLISIGERQSSSAASYWSEEDEIEIIKLIHSVFADPTIRKVGQNSVGFDQPFLEKEFGFVFNNHDFDCMHGFHLLYPELPKGLSFLCSILTDYENYWTGKDTADDLDEWRYNCWDTIITLEVYELIRQDLIESKLGSLYENHLHRLARALARAQERGVLINKERCSELTEHYTERRRDREQFVRLCAGEPELNINSHPQLKRLIYETMNCKKMLNRRGIPSTDEECLKKLMKRYPREEIFQGIVDYRKSGKMLDFLKAKVGPNGRMQTSFNASGTETGRISSSKTIWGTGMNLMNVPKHLRDIFVAPEGRSFIKEDLSQAETMVVAEILKRHGDSTLWDRYQDPDFDIHRWMASCIYRKPEHRISKTERNVGKIANHSGNYRAGPKVLETAAVKYGIPGISYQVAKEILRERSRALPGLEKWWQWIEDELRRTRTLWTCLGRRRIFFGRLDHKTFRNATAFEPQSTVGDATNIIFTDLDDRLDNDCYPVLQVHDEVVIECPDPKIGECLDILKEVGQVKLWINEDKPLIIPMDIGIGKDWKNCKEIT